MVLAAEALTRDAEAIALTLDGSPHKGALYRTFKDAALADSPVTIANAGASTGAGGADRHRQPDRRRSRRRRRATRSSAAIYQLDGSQGQPGPGAPERSAGGRRSRSRRRSRSWPACCWSTACRPASRSTTRSSSRAARPTRSPGWRRRSSRPHTEFRDDRFVAAFDRSEDEPAFFTVAYMVRAVVARPLRPSAGAGRGHVPPRPFRPHGFRKRGGRRPARP